MENNLLIKNISVSQLGTLSRDGGAWQNQYLFGNYDNEIGQAAAIGTLAHRFAENLIRSGGDELFSINSTYDCIWDYGDSTYILDPNKLEKPIDECSDEEKLNNFGTKLVDFGKSGSKQELTKKLKAAIESYLSEKINFGDVLGVEVSMTHEITEQILDYKFETPVPLKCISDVVCRLTEDRQVVTANKEVLTIPAGSLYIEDYKFKEKYSDMDFDNPQYFFQAMFNYYCVQREYGETPAFMNFREVKYTKNRDGSSQQQTITFLFSGEDFEIQKTWFWRYLMGSIKYIQFLQENDIVYNVFDFQGGVKAWKKQLAFYQSVDVKDVKVKMSVANRSKTSGNNTSGHKFNLLDKGQKLEKGEIAEIITTEDKIRSKLREFGVDVKFKKTIEGYSFNQMLFEPGRGIKISDIKNKEEELCLGTKTQNIRVAGVIGSTGLVGIDVPREERVYLDLNKYKRKARGLKFPIGNTVSGEVIEADLTDSNFPHLLIQGATGGGKTEELRVIIECLKGKADLIIVDPKMAEFDEDDGEYYYDPEQVWAMLDKEYVRIKRINSLIKKLAKAKGDKTIKDIDFYNKNVAKKDRIKHKVLIIDEVADLRFSLYGKEIAFLIENIAAIGRSVGVHLILASQRFDTKVLSGRLKNNIPTRISYRTGSGTDSRVLLDVEGAEKLLGKGDGLFKNGPDIQRIQSYWIDPKKA